MARCPVEGCDGELPEPPIVKTAPGFGQEFRSHADCPKCGTPLMHFDRGAVPGWHVDVGEKRRRDLAGS